MSHVRLIASNLVGLPHTVQVLALGLLQEYSLVIGLSRAQALLDAQIVIPNLGAFGIALTGADKISNHLYLKKDPTERWPIAERQRVLETVSVLLNKANLFPPSPLSSWIFLLSPLRLPAFHRSL